MKLKIMALALFTVSVAGVAHDAPKGALPQHLFTSINVKNRTPLNLKDVTGLRSYASSNNYYFTVNLHDGMRVLYSASYGIGGEAAQARGKIVAKDGHFWFKQEANPSGNLLLPPGLTFDSGNDMSLWDIGQYLDLVNRVAFSDPNKSYQTANDIYGAPDAYTVDFDGGTADESVSYTGAMEVDFHRSSNSRSESDLKVYYAKGIGPVAVEFREDMEPAGTFKFYLGD